MKKIGLFITMLLIPLIADAATILPDNPKTGDGIGLIVIGVVVALVGICVVVMLIKED